MVAWRELISELKTADEATQIEQVNAFFNQLNFVNDIDLWGKSDYWATPFEFIGANAGDCEDFTIAKYYSLRELGIDDEKLRLVYVKAIELDQFHMVLAYYPSRSAMPILLDNLDKSLKPADQRNDLLPIYSFNAKHLWIMKENPAGKLAGNSSRLSLWNNLRERERTQSLKKPLIQY